MHYLHNLFYTETVFAVVSPIRASLCAPRPMRKLKSLLNMWNPRASWLKSTTFSCTSQVHICVVWTAPCHYIPPGARRWICWLMLASTGGLYFLLAVSCIMCMTSLEHSQKLHPFSSTDLWFLVLLHVGASGKPTRGLSWDIPICLFQNGISQDIPIYLFENGISRDIHG